MPHACAQPVPLRIALTVGIQRRLSLRQRASQNILAATYAHSTYRNASMPDRVLISFDVDGTLIHSVGDQSNKVHKLAFQHAFKEVFGVDTHIDVVQHHGSTDPLILIKVLGVAGIPEQQAMERLPALQAAMLDYFARHKLDAANGLALLPGVLDLMQHLKALSDSMQVATCLVTGNLEPIGWGKMEALGLLPCFTQPLFGGFGSDTCSGNHAEAWKDRAELVRIAARKAQGAGLTFSRHYHVGDTPMDIMAAEAGGAIAIGVLTGVYTKEQLTGASQQNALILDGLHQMQDFLNALQLQTVTA